MESGVRFAVPLEDVKDPFYMLLFAPTDPFETDEFAANDESLVPDDSFGKDWSPVPAGSCGAGVDESVVPAGSCGAGVDESVVPAGSCPDTGESVVPVCLSGFGTNDSVVSAGSCDTGIDESVVPSDPFDIDFIPDKV